MKNHKVVDIKITYEPEHMTNMEEFEKKINAFLDNIKGTKGAKISAKKHNVAIDVMLDEYGLEIG
jgi:GH25 family lysozyme M1 (1,4-beta-N-acetylmuramidase)